MAEEKRYATQIFNKADGKTYDVRDVEAHEAIAAITTSLEQKANISTTYTRTQTDDKLRGYVPLTTYNQLLTRVIALEDALQQLIGGGTIVTPPNPDEPENPGEDESAVTFVDDDGNSIIASFVDENDNVYQVIFEEVTDENQNN